MQPRNLPYPGAAEAETRASGRRKKRSGMGARDFRPRAPTLGEMSGTALIQALRERTERHPERPAFTFLIDGEREASRWTYGELDRRAQSIAVQLRDAGLAGERAL